MTTTKAILTGAGVAALLAAGPLLWRAQQISDAERPPAPPAAAALVSKGEPSSEPAASTAAKQPATSPEKPADMEEVMAVLEEEFKSTAAEWARQNAWLQARRIGHAAGLPREREDALRAWLEARTLKRMSNDNDAPPEGRLARGRALAEWMQQHLTPDELARWQETDRVRRAEQVENAAESALHGISTAIVLTPEQKTKLYEAAAAKATAALETDDSAGSVNFGAAYNLPAPPPLEDDPALLAGVLDPAQMELWEQARAREHLLQDVMPRRVADRVLEVVKERGFGPMILEAIRSASAEE